MHNMEIVVFNILVDILIINLIILIYFNFFLLLENSF